MQKHSYWCPKNSTNASDSRIHVRHDHIWAKIMIHQPENIWSLCENGVGGAQEKSLRSDDDWRWASKGSATSAMKCTLVGNITMCNCWWWESAFLAVTHPIARCRNIINMASRYLITQIEDRHCHTFLWLPAIVVFLRGLLVAGWRELWDGTQSQRKAGTQNCDRETLKSWKCSQSALWFSNCMENRVIFDKPGANVTSWFLNAGSNWTQRSSN